jgi:hypothetical protein
MVSKVAFTRASQCSQSPSSTRSPKEKSVLAFSYSSMRHPTPLLQGHDISRRAQFKTAHKLLVYYMDSIGLRVNIVYNMGSERPTTLMKARYVPIDGHCRRVRSSRLIDETRRTDH